MTTKRTPLKRNNVVRITPQLLDVYAIVKVTYCDDAREDQHRGASIKLHERLRRAPWQEDISDMLYEDEPPDWMMKQDGHRIAEWHNAHAIRVQRDEALKQRGS